MQTIGIIGKRDPDWTENYYQAVEAGGHKAFEIKDLSDVSEIKNLDGILIPGGVDLDPALYHEKNIDCRGVNDPLDELEYAVIKEAVKCNKKILGICRGLQILNVYFGGSLIQNLDCSPIHERTGDFDKVHNNKNVPGEFIEKIYQAETIYTNSAHHQAIKELAKGFIIGQYSEDGVIEAFRHESLPIYGVQWHPERMCLKHKREDTVDGWKIFEFFYNL